MKKMKVKMGAVIQPLAEDPSGEPVPVVNFGASSVIRCKNCRAYINPFVQFIENGRRWKCNMCSSLNEVPKPYFCHLDGNGKRADLNERPELRKGQVEFVAPGEYMVRPPQAPCFVFVIDVSAYAVSSGMLQATVDTIKEQLETMPGNPRTQIGFITFDKEVIRSKAQVLKDFTRCCTLIFGYFKVNGRHSIDSITQENRCFIKAPFWTCVKSINTQVLP